ncbi:MAG: hypothetical protein WD066_08095 [Planctomycetaceae bacterium]
MFAIAFRRNSWLYSAWAGMMFGAVVVTCVLLSTSAGRKVLFRAAGDDIAIGGPVVMLFFIFAVLLFSIHVFPDLYAVEQRIKGLRSLSDMRFEKAVVEWDDGEICEIDRPVTATFAARFRLANIELQSHPNWIRQGRLMFQRQHGLPLIYSVNIERGSPEDLVLEIRGLTLRYATIPGGTAYLSPPHGRCKSNK